MQCTVNGELHYFETDITIATLLDHLDVDDNRIVVEHNGELIKKSVFKQQEVKNNDRLELLEFVGGG
ncbi:sulfur carrier protein ThiS [Jeotgalicoccus sp. ATCC 8456]|uniref:sulfur carrier protein ThiS n=1 Tax=Jeotgalicoccus sp. ATCC 8456 TaxID=946435 RepID=UPI0018E5F7AE|nr:sulfur carrier protein ThiS [Jeotgalicoccus sp. ATCC 8456]QQD84460.1 sulfur carrier protein ThiS [Jeotgalicoccus sp. ATCC 8456]